MPIPDEREAANCNTNTISDDHDFAGRPGIFDSSLMFAESDVDQDGVGHGCDACPGFDDTLDADLDTSSDDSDVFLDDNDLLDFAEFQVNLTGNRIRTDIPIQK